MNHFNGGFPYNRKIRNQRGLCLHPSDALIVKKVIDEDREEVECRNCGAICIRSKKDHNARLFRRVME